MSTPMEQPTVELTTLADRANEEHRAAEAAMTEALVHARNAGEALNGAKDRTPHGSWGDWVREHFEGSERTARLYQRIARNWSRLEDRQHVADLSIRGAVRVLQEGDGDSEPDGDDPDGWPVEPGHAAIVNTPELIAECQAWILPSDHEGYFWLTIITGEEASAQNKPVHGSVVLDVLRFMGFPMEYADWVHLGAPEPTDYNRLLFRDRDHQFAEEIKRWKQPDDFQARANRRRRAARKGYDY